MINTSTAESWSTRCPNVSVVILNYNHSLFVYHRFVSVLEQTSQNFEIVYIDDASSDESNAVSSRFLDDEWVTAIILSKNNSGNPFKQWNKGVRASTGEYIWIAESDDFADRRLLEQLVQRLDTNPAAGLAYCQSWEVDEYDNILRSMEQHTADLDPHRWQSDFGNTGKDECGPFLVKNTIPNASAVLFRRRVYECVGGADEDLTVAGDWMLWAKMLLISDICFCAEPLNYSRAHLDTVRRKSIRTGLATEEQYRVISFIADHVTLSDAARQAAYNAAAWSWVKHTCALRIGFDQQRRIYRLARTIDPQIKVRLVKTAVRLFARALSQTAKAGNCS